MLWARPAFLMPCGVVCVAMAYGSDNTTHSKHIRDDNNSTMMMTVMLYCAIASIQLGDMDP